MRDDVISVFSVSDPAGEKLGQSRLRLSGIIASFILKGRPLMTATQTTNVTDLLTGEMPAHLVAQLALRTGT